MYGKYHLFKKQLSWDSGVTWYDSDPLVTVITGDPVATYETYEQCIGGIYRWVVVSGGYECSGTTKMTQEKEQISYDSGTTWGDVIPLTTRAALPVIEYASEDCGYVPPFEGEYKLTLNDSSIVSANCRPSSNIITSGTVSAYKYTTVDAVVGNCIRTIDDYAFIDFGQLTSVTISDTVTNIGTAPFSNAYNLKRLNSDVDGVCNIPSGLTSLSYGFMSSHTGFTSVVIPDSVTIIGDYAFYECSGLTAVTIPSAVTNIDAYAFQGCSSLTSITCLPTAPPRLEYYGIFGRTNDCPIYVPAESVDRYKGASYWDRFASRIQPIPT